MRYLITRPEPDASLLKMRLRALDHGGVVEPLLTVSFDAPDAIDLARRPNPHVTFGYGPHLCLGAPLARLEAAIALPRLHARYPQMQLADRPLTWTDGLGLRAPESLPVHLGPRR
mgnify:CR=1 FL=1